MVDVMVVVEKVMDGFEDTTLMVATRLGPWLAPIGPAYFVGRAVHQHLEAHVAVSWIMAAVVEIVGIAAAHTALKCWHFNATKKAKEPAAPFNLMIGLSFVYVAAAITLSILVEVFHGLVTYAPAIFIFLAAVAYVTIPVQLRLKQMYADRDVSQRRIKTVPEVSRLRQSSETQDKIILDTLRDNPKPNMTQLAKDIGIGRATLYRRLETLKDDGEITQNGVGIKVMKS